MEFRSRYNHGDNNQYATINTEESLTQQQFKAECDINNIMAKYKKTGLITHVNRFAGHIGDFSSGDSYQESLHKVMAAQESFNALPAHIRSRFFNDPAQMLDFLSDPKNDEEAVKLGLRETETREPTMQEAFENALSANDQKRQKTQSKKD
nr:MAG: internal scaffolding protein [Microvirus sp.]